jgi:hypothetical protein
MPGYRRSTSPSTGSAESRSSAASRTSIRSPPDSHAQYTKNSRPQPHSRIRAPQVERARRDEDPPGPGDRPQRALRGGVLHARTGRAVRPGSGIKVTQLITRPPQLGLGQQPQIGLGSLLAHRPSLHRAGPRGRPPPPATSAPEARPSPDAVTLAVEDLFSWLSWRERAGFAAPGTGCPGRCACRGTERPQASRGTEADCRIFRPAAARSRSFRTRRFPTG